MEDQLIESIRSNQKNPWWRQLSIKKSEKIEEKAKRRVLGFMKIENTKYGFKWGEVLVERTYSNEKKPKFQILRIYAPNGEIIEVIMKSRKNQIIFTKPVKK